MDIYAYQRLIGKIEDDKNLRDEFIHLFDLRTKEQIARFGLSYANHICKLVQIKPFGLLKDALDAVSEWLEGKTSYHKARNITLKHIFSDIKIEVDIVKRKFLKTMSQITCIPHVKAHGLWATDMAITLINALYPNDLDKVKLERKYQIELLSNIKTL
ncbi:hypothetical protein JV173_06410 [Acholeplasma equirhinis]|uniref:putative immunity protein n=1 Tax=Acholeplasma equirhinis TaxID=555393 RepID=UPI00197AA34D|nr:hypothetical protein [Acholeplasma equirhinis]MBN3491131.1 hypothetical protein [Acholeplasma equirhinis]